MWASLPSSASGGVTATVIMPSPPASDTAAHSSSEQTGPIPASWMGTLDPNQIGEPGFHVSHIQRERSLRPEISQRTDMLSGVDLLRRHEMMYPREPSDVDVPEQPSQDGGPHLLLLAGQVPVAEDDRTPARARTQPIELRVRT